MIDRTANLKEPTLNKVKDSSMIVSKEQELCNYTNDIPYGIIGPEGPKSIKNMSAGFLTLYSKGIVYECISAPPKISDSLKGHFDTLTSYGAWEAGGIVGLAAKYSFLAIKDSIKDSKTS